MKFKRGLDLPQSKLNDELVRRIRRQHARKEKLKKKLDAMYGAAALADRYGVSVPTITKVLTFETWRHVRDEEPRRVRARRDENKRTLNQTDHCDGRAAAG